MEDVVEYRHILVDREDGVVTITFNEPRYLNPWLIPMMEELMVEIDRVKADPDDRVLVFTGAGDAFRGGMIKGLVEHKPIQRCVEMGTVAAHYVVRVNGTQNYTFTPAEFNATLERCFGG